MGKSAINLRGSRLQFQLTLNFVEDKLLTAVAEPSVVLSSIRKNQFVVHGLGHKYRPYVRTVVEKKEKELRMSDSRPRTKGELTPAVKSSLKDLVTLREKDWKSGRLNIVSSRDADKQLEQRISDARARLQGKEKSRAMELNHV